MADTSKPKEPKPKRWRALWYITTLAFRADPVRATISAVVSLVAAMGTSATAFMAARMIGAIAAGDSDRAVLLGAAAAGLGALWLAAAIAQLDLRFRMEEATTLVIDREIIAMTTRMPGLEQHERPEHLDRLELLRSQRGSLGGSIGALIQNASTFTSIGTTSLLLATIDPVLLVLPLFGIPSVVASGLTRRWWQKVEEQTAERLRLNEHLYRLATTGAPAKELRIFGLRRELRERYTQGTAEIHRIYDRTNVKSTLTSTAGWTIFALGYVGAIALVARRAVHGQSELSDVVLVITLAAEVNNQVNGMYWTVGWLMDTLKTVSRYLRLMEDATASRPVLVDPVDPPDRITVGIDLHGVTFRYPGTEVDVLGDVDLHLPAGSTVAIVGDNGVGKSTLIKLLSRFYDPTEGSISVDGVDLRRIPVDAWRERMAAGFQDFAKLELIARETVGVGDLRAIDDAALVNAALERASATDVIDGLPAGLDTQVGKMFEEGHELSGGQWQKLALGRAMMRERPLLLVLDEPTAALDADTEHALFERYAGAAQTLAAETGGITVLVSHRFSTVRMADLIVVMGDGGIAEVGTHRDLVTKAGVYAELYELQARAYR
ncbi:MAG TPA: ABC transporter ATP-binding protein [Acidimicrobiales bacterium]|nr:ABC transporter ATP-binding protein [Acidimicrobiales bacterium]